jgi:hypothetical protein
MPVFKKRYYACRQCDEFVERFAWEPCCVDHGTMFETGDRMVLERNKGVIDDQLEGGARWCETMGHQPVWLDGSKSQWRKEVAKRGLTNVVRHDSDYYRKQRKELDEKRRDERL